VLEQRAPAGLGRLTASCKKGVLKLKRRRHIKGHWEWAGRGGKIGVGDMSLCASALLWRGLGE
jgi:hypothetical protein